MYDWDIVKILLIMTQAEEGIIVKINITVFRATPATLESSLINYFLKWPQLEKQHKIKHKSMKTKRKPLHLITCTKIRL